MRLEAPVPIFRIFDLGLAHKFYVDWLGFRKDWEHQTNAPAGPHYLQICRGGCVLHLSEHHGDCTPGSKAIVEVDDVESYHRELRSRPNPFMNPDLEELPWARVLEVIDPFGNRLCFSQSIRGTSGGV